MEAIDASLTKILTRADQQCRPLSSIPWSPAIKKAYLIHRYGSLTFTAKKTERDLSTSLESIAQCLPPKALNQDPNVSLSAKLQKAQKDLKAAKREADKLRQQHLEVLLNKAKIDNKQKRTTALKYLIRAECNRLCYAHFRQHTKPKASGGLAYITVPDDSGIQKPLLDKHELESTLLEHSHTHFAQAEGSPFTVKPLNCLLQYDGLTPYGDRITQGKPFNLHDFNEPTCAILKHLQRKVHVVHSPVPSLNHDMLLNGIRKWPERTTTSPLGCHLGIYKALGKNVIDKKQTNKETEPNETIMNEIKDRCDVLYIIFDLMTLAL